MKQGLSLLVFLGYYTFSQGIFVNSAIAQVTPDSTTNTTVEVNGNDFTINNGDRAGGNLFHSFSDFSVPNGGSAFFNNAVDVNNIFSRITGGNISNIDGLLRANGAANLFLINPAGIIFGEGARLDIGGSFLGSTADSIVFPDGEFSALDPANPPLLTINAPIGLNLRDNPGDIVNRSDLRETEDITNIIRDEVEQLTIVDRIGLQVNPGENFTLVGGNIFLDDSGITAPGGRVNLGGLSEAGEVTINPDSTLTFPDGVIRSDIALNNGATVNVTAGGGGFINIDTRNLSLAEQSQIVAGIANNSGFPGAQAGDITINATESVTVSGANALRLSGLNTSINNIVGINPRKIDDSAQSNNVAMGNAGRIFINTNSLVVDNTAHITTTSFSEGNSGDIFINTTSLNVGAASSILAARRRDSPGMGNAGNITINATDSIVLDGGSSPSRSQISTRMQRRSSSTRNDAGDIKINTGRLILRNGIIISDSAAEAGNAGNTIINATEFVSLDSSDGTVESGSDNLISLILAQAQSDLEGNGGNITISAPEISLDNFSLISINLAKRVEGEAGSITLNADTISVRNGSVIDALTETDFDGGDITINADLLELSSGGKIVTGADRIADAGDINLNINDEIILSNVNPPEGSPFNEDNLVGVELQTGIFANNFPDSTGNGGNITISADKIVFEEQSIISAETVSGVGGDINIDTDFIVATPNQNNDIIANAVSGNGGNINITAQALFGIEERPLNDITNDINASSEFGLDGSVSIATPDINRLQTEIELPSGPIEAEQTVAQACQSDRFADNSSGLTIKGKGGIPSIPTNPFDSETILVDEEVIPSNIQTNYPEIKPIATSIGDIYPARGIIKTQEGKIILTAYATDNLNNRTPNISADCTSVGKQ